MKDFIELTETELTVLNSLWIPEPETKKPDLNQSQQQELTKYFSQKYIQYIRNGNTYLEVQCKLIMETIGRNADVIADCKRFLFNGLREAALHQSGIASYKRAKEILSGNVIYPKMSEETFHSLYGEFNEYHHAKFIQECEQFYDDTRLVINRIIGKNTVNERKNVNRLTDV